MRDDEYNKGCLLNNKVRERMMARDTAVVEVEVDLKFGEKDYTVKRTVEYVAFANINDELSLNIKKTDLKLYYVSNTGQTVYIDDAKVQDKLNSIIPKELSDYLFMKAEEIESMGLNILNSLEQKNYSNEDFSLAIKKILGLEPMENALRHIAGDDIEKPTPNSVIALFNKEYDAKSNTKISNLRTKIEDITKKITDNEKSITRAENDIKTLNSRNAQLIANINQFKDGKEQQTKISQYNDTIDSNKQTQERLMRSELTSFVKSLPAYLYQHIGPDVLSTLENTDLENKNIPGINNKTIECLINRGYCICGHKLELGNDEYNNLVDLLKVVPPKSIATSVSRYIGQLKSNLDINRLPDIASDFANFKVDYIQCQSKIDDATEEKEKLSKHLLEYKDTNKYEAEKIDNEKNIESLSRKITTLKSQNVQYDSDLKKLRKDLDTISQNDSKNKRVNECIKHAEAIYIGISNIFNKKEKVLRNNIMNKMNEIYSGVFISKNKIKINDNYTLQIIGQNGDPLPLSGAQSVFVYLSFIVALLFFAQQIHYKSISETNEDNDYLCTEPYPLVLDAPFSKFDKSNRRVACKKLSELSEQIIIFAKDDEAEQIIESSQDKFGKYYEMLPATTSENNERDVLETNVIERDIELC